MRVVFMGGPWDGRAHEVDRPDLPYRVVARVEYDRAGVRCEERLYDPRRYVLPEHVARPAGHPGWVWVMVSAFSTFADCERLMERHTRPVVDGPIPRRHQHLGVDALQPGSAGARPSPPARPRAAGDRRPRPAPSSGAPSREPGVITVETALSGERPLYALHGYVFLARDDSQPARCGLALCMVVHDRDTRRTCPERGRYLVTFPADVTTLFCPTHTAVFRQTRLVTRAVSV